MNITQREAAELLDCSLLAYGRYERGDRKPSIEMLERMSRVFEVSIDYIVGNSGSVTPEPLSDNEKELLAAARSSDERAVQDAIALLNRNKI